MYCTNCGKQISDQAVFCHHCGAKQMEHQSFPTSTQPTPVAPPVNITPPQFVPPIPLTPPIPYPPINAAGYAQPPVNTIPEPEKPAFRVARVIFGILLILGGLAPYLFMTSNTTFLAGLYQTISAYGAIQISALSAVVGYIGIFDKLLTFPAHMFSLISGIVLLQSQRRHKGLLITNGIFHLLSALYYAFLPTIGKAIFAASVGSGYATEPFLDRVPVFSMLRENTLGHLALSLVVAILSFTVLFFKQSGIPLKKERCGPCLFIMLPFLGLFVLAGNIESGVLSSFLGYAGTAAYTSANTVLANHLGNALLWIFIGVISVSLALRKVRFSWFSLIAGGALIICSALFYTGLPISQIPDELISHAVEFYPLLYWGNALMLIATVLWIISATRNCVPLWLQWLLCIFLFPIRIFTSAIVFAVRSLSVINIGQFVCAIIILLAAITAGLVNSGKKHIRK